MSKVPKFASACRWALATVVSFSIVSCFNSAAIADSSDRDVLIADFEQVGYGQWKASGDAFGPGPAAGTLPGQMEVSGYRGDRLVNSYHQGDGTTGTLQSAPFPIRRPYLNFLIGGGGHESTRVELVVDEKVVRTATGTNTAPGGSERLRPVHWDLTDLAGQTAVLRVVDLATGIWGHINLDHVVASDRPAGSPAEELAAEADWQTFLSYLDVGYDQSHRPQFHFTSRKNWLNDPNGMVYSDGEYHLFFQHNPRGVKWGNMTWGHAVSPDMVHWRQLPHAIMPYRGGTIYSGTAAIDEQNTLGLASGDAETIVAAFTFAHKPFAQALATSTDRGRTFQLWDDGRPVVENQGYDPGERDPKIFWHGPSKKWVMVLWVKQGKPGRVLFFNSTNLTDWEVVSHFDRDWVYECMDFVELPIDGDPEHRKWLLYDASFDYELGDFDGQTFTTDGQAFRGEYGRNYYAAQSFNNSPDERTVIIGWMRGGDEAPFLRHDMPFNQQMSFPTTIELRTTPEGIRLFRWPVAEIERLHTHGLTLNSTSLAEAQEQLGSFRAELLDFSLEFAATADTSLVITLRGQRLGYRHGEFHYGPTRIPARPVDGKVSVRVLVDRTSLEIFANQGRAVATEYADLDPVDRSIHLEASDGVQITRLAAHQLRSIWESRAPSPEPSARSSEQAPSSSDRMHCGDAGALRDGR